MQYDLICCKQKLLYAVDSDLLHNKQMAEREGDTHTAREKMTETETEKQSESGR